jgi:hypothetical protein
MLIFADLQISGLSHGDVTMISLIVRDTSSNAQASEEKAAA